MQDEHSIPWDSWYWCAIGVRRACRVCSNFCVGYTHLEGDFPMSPCRAVRALGLDKQTIAEIALALPIIEGICGHRIAWRGDFRRVSEPAMAAESDRRLRLARQGAPPLATDPKWEIGGYGRNARRAVGPPIGKASQADDSSTSGLAPHVSRNRPSEF